jgi:hypothetical protein
MITTIFAWWTVIGFACTVILPGPSKFPHPYCKIVAIVEAIISGPIGWILFIIFSAHILYTRKRIKKYSPEVPDLYEHQKNI